MKIFRIIGVVALIAICGFTASAQKNYKKEADFAFSDLKYYKAIEMYKKAYTKETKPEVKAEILFQIAECYRGKRANTEAAVWYGKAIKAKYPDPISNYHIANIYKAEGRYEDAIVQFNKYKAANPSDNRTDAAIKSCQSAKEWLDKPTSMVVNAMPQINSEDMDFSPVFSDKKNMEVYFTSTRQGATGSAIHQGSGANFSDLWVSKRDRKGKWSEPTVVSGSINSPVTEGSSSLNSKRNEIYFTRCEVKKDGIAGCGIMTAKKAGQKWSEPKYIEIADDSMKVRHPAISPDDKVLVFSADLEGGQGGVDLWYITYDKKAKTWSSPTNLGAEINTSGDEAFPYIKANGDLYFASNGHPGMGGLDIFKASSAGTNQWGGVENMQAPMNSSGDDFGIMFEGNKDRGFFNTDRAGGKGGDDIWEFYVPPVIFSLEGVVKDGQTNKVLPNATIKLIGTDGSSAQTTSDASGNFYFVENGPSARYINPETSYSLVVERDGYLNAKGKATTLGLEKSKKFLQEYSLQPFGEDAPPLTLPLIEYKTAKWDLQPQFKDSLNYLYDIMLDNPTLIIELRSHTDHRGSTSANQRLSQKRAQSCVDYLIKEKGVNAARIKARGMGENEPIKGASGKLLTKAFIDKLPSKQEKDIALQRNRRTDFKVIGTNFVPSSGN